MGIDVLPRCKCDRASDDGLACELFWKEAALDHSRCRLYERFIPLRSCAKPCIARYIPHLARTDWRSPSTRLAGSHVGGISS